MTNQPERREFTYRQAVAAAVDDVTVDALGRALMRDEVRGHGLVLDGPVETISDEPYVLVQVTLEDGTPATQLEPLGGPRAAGYGEADVTARMIEWRGYGVPQVADPDPVMGQPIDGVEGVVGEVADGERAAGGTVIFKHGIPDPIIAAQTATGEGIGYLFAVEIEPGEHQVETMPGTARLIATEDPTSGQENDQ